MYYTNYEKISSKDIKKVLTSLTPGYLGSVYINEHIRTSGQYITLYIISIQITPFLCIAAKGLFHYYSEMEKIKLVSPIHSINLMCSPTKH